MTTPAPFALRGDHITLDALLKATGLAPSGGAAKAMIADGMVTVDGTVEQRRGRKLRAGMVVQVGDQAVCVEAPDAAPGRTAADEGTGRPTR